MNKEINYGGYTANGSDYGSADGELAAAMGLVNEEGQLRSLDAPKMLVRFNIGNTTEENAPDVELESVLTPGAAPYMVKYIHKTNAYTHYIVAHDEYMPNPNRYGCSLWWLDERDIGEGELVITDANKDSLLHDICTLWASDGKKGFSLYNIEAVGNTLVVLAEDGLHYCLWSEGDYKNLGSHLPELPLSFGLQGNIVSRSGRVELMETPENAPGDDETKDLNLQEVDVVTNNILAQVNSLIADIQSPPTIGDNVDRGRFVFPFFVRYAYRLYDGSLTMHSSPVLMPTSSSCMPLVYNLQYQADPFHNYWDYNVAALAFDLDYICLDAAAKTALEEWSDIVQSVDVFVSAPIYRYNQSGKVTQWAKKPNTSFGYTVSKVSVPLSPSPYEAGYAKQLVSPTSGQVFHFVLPQYTDDKVEEDIKSRSAFYLLKSIQLDDIEKDEREVISIARDYLPSLTSREVMTDDYDSHDKLMPKNSYVYNSRLSIAALTKQLAAPLHPNVYKPYETGSKRVRVYFYIKQDQREYVAATPLVQIGARGGAAFQAFRYLYYPDGNAYKALVVHESNTPGQYESIVEIPLKRHDFLNGAYFFDGWEPTGQTGVIPELSADLTAPMYNKLYTSEVNNPFFFPVSGIATVGSGEVLGMAAAVKAISQNEFGREPMYVFTTEGVWAMQVTAEGGLEPAKPVTLDVCTDPASITHLDNTVLFATERGIMMLGGTEALCITDTLLAEEEFDISTLSRLSEVLSSDIPVDVAPFKEYLSGCRLLYDYKRQRIVVFNPSYNYAYIYSLKSKLWGMMPSELNDVVDGYPDTLAMAKASGNVTELVSLEENPGEEYEGLLVTRPLKLGDGNVYKSIHNMVQRGKFEKGHVKTLLYASRDLWNWYLVASSNGHWIRGLRGTGYKWYRVVLLTELEKGESVSGATVEFEVKQARKIH